MSKSANPSFNHQARMILLVLLLLGVGCLVYYLATPFGIGIRHDSLGYIEIAENLVAGNGLVFNDGSPLRQWAPMYPLLLAFTANIANNDMTTAALWLHGFLFLLSGVILAWTVARFLELNHFNLVFSLTFLAFIFTADMLEMYTLLLSEAAFITVIICGTFFGLRFAEKNRPFDLLALSFSFTFAVTIRFMGLFLLLPALVLIWLMASINIKKKIGATAVFLAIFLPPIGWWLWHGQQLASSVGGDVAYFTQSAFPLPNIKHAQQALLHSSAWFLPEAIPVIPRVLLFGLLGLLLIALLVRQWRRLSSQSFLTHPQWLLTTFALTFMGSYAAALVGSMITIAIGITPTERYLAPLVPFAIMVLAVVLTKIIEDIKVGTNGRIIRPALILLFSVYLVFGTLTVQAMHREGVGHITRTIMNSQLIAFVRNLPDDTLLYSNEQPRLETILGRDLLPMPLRERYFQRISPEIYQQQFEAMTADLTQNKGYLIIMLDISAYERQILDLDSVLSQPQLTEFEQFEEGYVLQAEP